MEILGRTPRKGYAKNAEVSEPIREVLAALGRDDLLHYDMPTGSGAEVLGAYCGNSDLQFARDSTSVLPSDCILATLSDLHFSRNTRLGDKTSFQNKFREAKQAMRMDKSAGLTSAFHNECVSLRGCGLWLWPSLPWLSWSRQILCCRWDFCARRRPT